MKNLFKFIALFLFVLPMLSSCVETKKHLVYGYTDRISSDPTVFVVEKVKRKGSLYGLMCNHKMVVPVHYNYWEEGINSHCWYFSSDGGKTKYLIDLWGREFITGKQATERDFCPIPIVKAIKPDYKTGRYFENIFGIGHLWKFVTADGAMYAVFEENARYAGKKYGPYQDFFPGCGGYMYKDLSSGKWGANAEQYGEPYGSRIWTIKPAPVAQPMYDKIIEVVRIYKPNIWFAYDGNKWIALDETGKEVALNKALLNRVLAMKIQDKACKPLGNQRIGNNEISVVFI